MIFGELRRREITHPWRVLRREAVLVLARVYVGSKRAPSFGPDRLPANYRFGSGRAPEMVLELPRRRLLASER